MADTERVEETVCEDRISELPEDLQIRILALLGTKDAVSTMLLSKRWRYTWTKVLELEYRDSDVDDSDSDSDEDRDEDTDNENEDNDYNNDNDNDEDEDSDNENEDTDNKNEDYDYNNDNDNDENEDTDNENEDNDYNNDNDNDEDEDSDNDDNNEEVEKVESKKSVWCFLDKTLELHNAPVIHKLYMELGRQCPTDVDIGKWVAKAVDRGVLYLKFKLLWSADPITLPKSLYSCKSLVELTLSHKVLVDVPFPACLSSLKKLYLNNVVYKDEDSIVRLLSGCPVLKSLVVERLKNDNVKKFNVKVPSLLYLEYESNNVGDTDGCLIIDTLTLMVFIIREFSRDYCSMENIQCLAYADIDFRSYPDDRLLRSLSSVLVLRLCLTDELLWCFSTINFSQLEQLTILPRESDWWAPLMLILGNSSKLKSLSIDYIYIDEPENLPLTWNQQSSVPGCLSSQLEVFEWIGYEGREEEEQFLTYILAHSKFLKTVQIALRSSPEEEQMIMERKLKDIPMASKTSQLLFK